MSNDRSQAMDHVVLAMFENRSFDNLLGHLYGPEDGKTFEGAIGKELLEHARQSGVEIPSELTDPNMHPSAEQILASLRSVAAQFFPRLASAA